MQPIQVLVPEGVVAARQPGIGHQHIQQYARVASYGRALQMLSNTDTMHATHHLPMRAVFCSKLSELSLNLPCKARSRTVVTAAIVRSFIHTLLLSFEPTFCRLPACVPACLPAWVRACLPACLPACIAYVDAAMFHADRVPWDTPLCCADWLVLSAWPGPVTFITAAARQHHEHHQDTYLV